jgi:predicted acyltransferase
MLGVFAGYILKSSDKGLRKVWILTILGITMMLTARLWNPFHPIIKHIWTGSFVLFAGGICYLLLALFYAVTDIARMKGWAKAFVIIGANSIVAYTAWHLFDFGLVADVFTTGLKTWAGGAYDFIRGTAAFLVIFLILKYMYRQKIFIKV